MIFVTLLCTIFFVVFFSSRLAQKCGQLVGDIGEEELYLEFKKTQNLHEFLCKEFTKDCVGKKKDEL